MNRPDGRRERSVYVRDGRGRFSITLPRDTSCPQGRGNRTGYHLGCRCCLCTAANTAYTANHRKEMQP